MKYEEKKENYFLCSKELVDVIKPECVSKPFKSGYHWDDAVYFVALLDFDKVEEVYLVSKATYDDFWCRECVGGTMDVSKITIKGSRENGLFVEIENRINLTTEKNIAMTIKELSDRFNCTPIEFINKINK